MPTLFDSESRRASCWSNRSRYILLPALESSGSPGRPWRMVRSIVCRMMPSNWRATSVAPSSARSRETWRRAAKPWKSRALALAADERDKARVSR